MKMKINALAIIILIVIFGGIAVTIALDVWTTESDKTPARYNKGDYAGEYDPQDIRGSYTFQDVSTLFNIDLQVLYKAFGIDENTDGNNIKMKDLEIIYSDLGVEIGNSSMQVFIALYNDLPITLDDSFLPSSAVKIVQEHNTDLTQEQKEYLSEHQISLDTESKGIKVDSEEKEEEGSFVNGSSTFKQVLDLGITKEQIESVIGDDMPASNLLVRDYCKSNGLQFSTIKNELNALIE